jgi:hypothetical protein
MSSEEMVEMLKVVVFYYIRLQRKWKWSFLSVKFYSSMDLCMCGMLGC